MEFNPILAIFVICVGYFLLTRIILPARIAREVAALAQDAAATQDQEVGPVAEALRTLVGQYVSRSYSDDYKSCERGVPTGEDYNVTVGDVRFYFRYAHYDLERVSVACVGTQVLEYRCQAYDSRGAQLPDKLTWVRHSGQLEQHVLEATKVLLDRISEFDRSRQEWLDSIEKRSAESTARAVDELRTRFGVDQYAVPRVKKQN